MAIPLVKVYCRFKKYGWPQHYYIQAIYLTQNRIAKQRKKPETDQLIPVTKCSRGQRKSTIFISIVHDSDAAGGSWMNINCVHLHQQPYLTQFQLFFICLSGLVCLADVQCCWGHNVRAKLFPLAAALIAAVGSRVSFSFIMYRNALYTPVTKKGASFISSHQHPSCFLSLFIISS
jgi:hypothetical protein